MRFLARCGMAAAFLGLAAAPAFAGDEAKVDTGDAAWMLVSTALVLMMTVPGVALFYAGMVRKKNVLATMMQSFSICALVSVLWMVAGYSLAFGEGNAWIGDFSRFFLGGLACERYTSLAKAPFHRAGVFHHTGANCWLGWRFGSTKATDRPRDKAHLPPQPALRAWHAAQECLDRYASQSPRGAKIPAQAIGPKSWGWSSLLTQKAGPL